ncbi:hypothetical protein KSP40_PGU000984 [Platanthera guangdongensis]|uniref:Uncharacterized protein n=1 Tax=Platanthera guangdongensis TaxID=2320717 RepID=A0ABR2MSS5_9ASPA
MMTTTISDLPGSFLLNRSAKTLVRRLSQVDSELAPRVAMPPMVNSNLFSWFHYARVFRALVLSSSPSDDLRTEIDDNPKGILSSEWPNNSSLLSYDDLKACLEMQITNDRMKPSALLGDVISTVISTVTMDQTLEEIDHNFKALWSYQKETRLKPLKGLVLRAHFTLFLNFVLNQRLGFRVRRENCTLFLFIMDCLFSFMSCA